MKKYLLIFTGILLLLMPEGSQASNNITITSKTTVSKIENFGGGRRNKNGQYRKRKGFLWGLFKGKNQCDCPKH
jgi:hypothetical protein